MRPPYPRRQPLHAPRDMDSIDGILLVDKPGGPTSHDVVAAVRHLLHFRKIGHGGALDPMATGLLVLLLGRGTKLSNQVMGADKVYEGVMRLGVATDTEDCDGKIVEEHGVSSVSVESLREEMNRRTGDIMQVPPMVSAIKKDGVPLYKLARKGQVIEREPRLIHVYEFRLTGYAPPDAAFTLRCTKGTYVRTLCADIGKALGCGAHLRSLRRTESGRFSVVDACPLDELRQMPAAAILERILPIHEAISHVAPPP